MCRTSSPPRRDLYELANELAANEGGFFIAPKPGRIAGDAWMEKRANHATAVWNGHYSAEGGQIIWHTKPWCVMTPTDFRTFNTHAEAIQYAFKETA